MVIGRNDEIHDGEVSNEKSKQSKKSTDCELRFWSCLVVIDGIEPVVRCPRVTIKLGANSYALI